MFKSKRADLAVIRLEDEKLIFIISNWNNQSSLLKVNLLLLLHKSDQLAH